MNDLHNWARSKCNGRHIYPYSSVFVWYAMMRYIPDRVDIYAARDMWGFFLYIYIYWFYTFIGYFSMAAWRKSKNSKRDVFRLIHTTIKILFLDSFDSSRWAGRVYAKKLWKIWGYKSGFACICLTGNIF